MCGNIAMTIENRRSARCDIRYALRAVIIATLALIYFAAELASAEEESGHELELQVGGAGEWSLDGEHSNFGVALGAQYTPVANWLELEVEFSALGTNGHPEYEGEFMFNKPFEISPTVEIEAGVGPSLTRTVKGPDKGTAVGVEFGLELNFHPFRNKRLGWYIEPSWSITPRNGEKSVGATTGLLIGF